MNLWELNDRQERALKSDKIFLFEKENLSLASNANLCHDLIHLSLYQA